MSIFNKEKTDQITKYLVDRMVNVAEVIIMVNNATGTYEVIKADDFIVNQIGDKGTTQDLFNALYIKDKKSKNETVYQYEEFTDLSVFEKNDYRANFHFYKNDKEYVYTMYQTRISPTEVTLFFRPKDNMSSSNELELEKVDTFQESYLYSMIVDLSNDACINPNTTQISADRQDYLDMKYSEWRLKISNMFMDEDKILFLRASSPENVINTLEDKAKFHLDIQMMNLEGKYIWCRLGFVRMQSFSRENPRFLYTVRDISEDMEQLLKQEGLTKAIEAQNETLQRAEKERTKLFANMSHEIRTPINAIMGMNDIIYRDSDDPTIKGYANDIKNASKLLLSLVNDILDLSKIKAGKMEIVPVEYNTIQMLQAICNLLKHKMEEKSLEFELNVAKDVPSVLFGDEIRISQILINILNNAIKYTDKGKITFTVERTLDASGNNAIRYTVEDTGIGIRENDIPKLFEEYSRLDLEKNRRVEGTGLGIGIITGLLAAMNSELEVDSTYGKGTKFSFVLTQKVVDNSPINGNMCEEQKEEIKNIFLKQKVLLVDDVPVNLKVAELIMKRYIESVDTARGGQEALEKIRENDYAMVAVDHLMPEMDGVEVLNKIRAMGGKYEKLPVVALTGNYSPTARDEYLSMGFTNYLEKPLSPERLNEVLKNIFE